MRHRVRTLMGTLLAASAIACGDADDTAAAGAMPAVGDSAAVAAGIAAPSPAELARLEARYPVLGAERAPAPTPSPAAGTRDVPASVRALPADVKQTVTGEATYYADLFEGRRTASGIPFRQNQMVAAHRAYPFGTLLRVTNTRNDRSVNVRVVDRGPWGDKAKARNTIIDLSRRAANQLGYVAAGRTPVKVEVLEWGAGRLASAN